MMKPIIIDVREPEEYETDHAKGAVNIPVRLISETTLTNTGIDREANILVYCRSGNRSAMALSILNRLGYEKVTNTVNQQETEKYLEKT